LYKIFFEPSLDSKVFSTLKEVAKKLFSKTKITN